MDKKFKFKVVGSNAVDKTTGSYVTYTMKEAIKKASALCFEQEVCFDNSVQTVTIWKLDDKERSVEVAALLTFDAFQCEDGRIKYYMIITDASNMNHDYRGNMK